MKKPKALSNKQIKKVAKRYEVSQSDLWKIDTAKYSAFLNSIKDSSLRKDCFQPLQIKAFNSKGERYVSLINCYMGGFPEITWNEYGTFDQYPLSQGKCKELDTVLGLEAELDMITPVNAMVMDWTPINEHEEIVLVYWSRMMHKRSKELIQYIENYRTQYEDKDIVVLYINNDNIYE